MFRRTTQSIRKFHSERKGKILAVQAHRSHSTNATTVQQDVGCSTKHVQLFGQPTPDTHPHILKNGELTPGLPLSEFKSRRSRFMKSLLENASKMTVQAENHLVVIPAAPQVYMSQKVPYVYRQNSDFLYLSGCLEPNSVLILSISKGASDHRSVMLIRTRDAHSELWDGPRTGVDHAPGLFGVDEALPYNDLEQYLQAYQKTSPSFMLWFDFMECVDPEVHHKLSDFIGDPKKTSGKMWDSPKKIIHQMRLIKSPAEQNLMRKSCQIASKAIIDTIAYSYPGVSEHELFATVDYHCRINGAEYLAYPPVVAGGERANIIHYINNSQVVNDGEMVLMDAGEIIPCQFDVLQIFNTGFCCEYHCYTSDITRTWPVSGKFSQPQRDLYEALLTVQEELITLLSAQPSLDDLFHAMCRLLGLRLKELGLIPAKLSAKEDIAKAAFSFCPHHVSHYLGMDVHDTGLIGRNLQVKPGMVVTVEPGVYISKTNSYAHKEFRGMGMRIEDDVLITEHGPEVLTAMCPKHPNEIEGLFQEKGHCP